jgi:cytochrome c oxidase cbb3-type subunit I/II
VPYPAGFEQIAIADASRQAQLIVTNLAQGQIKATPDKEIIALIAYLQRLGTDIKATNAPATPAIPAPPAKAAQLNDNNATARN